MVAIRRGFLDHHSQWTFNPNLTLEALLQSICTHLKKEPSSFIFQKPVDNVAFPNYRRVIAQPMDLSTLSRRVDSNYYTTYTAFHNDIICLFRNGCTFNACCDIWYQQCVVLKLVYMHIYSDLLHSGLLNSLQSQIPHSQVISVRRDGGSVAGFIESSSEWLHVMAGKDETDAFWEKYWSDGNGSFSLLRYRLFEVTEDFKASGSERSR